MGRAAQAIGGRTGSLAPPTGVGSYPPIGGLPEGQGLRRAIAKGGDGKLTQREPRKVERSVAQTVLEEQRAAGIAPPTDGLITWNDSQSHFARHLDGVEVNGLVRYFDTNTYYRQPVVNGHVRWREPATVAEWKFASSVAGGPVKAVITGPYTLATLSKADGRPRPEVVREFAESVGKEVRALRAAGATHLQVDE